MDEPRSMPIAPQELYPQDPIASIANQEPRSLSVPAEAPGTPQSVGVGVADIPSRLIGTGGIAVESSGLDYLVRMDIAPLQLAQGQPDEQWVPIWIEGEPYDSIKRVPVNAIPADAPHDDIVYGRQNGSWVKAIESLIIDWGDIENVPDTFPPSPHTHPISDVVDLQAQLNAIEADQTAQDNAIDTKEPKITAGAVTDFWRGDKVWAPLSSITVDAWTKAQSDARYVDVTGDTMTGKLTLPASVAGAAPITLPHGVDPTAPVNGDIWTTTTQVRARMNGTTRVLAMTSIDNAFSFVQTFKAGTTGSGSISIPHGVAPTSPTNGEMWSTTAGLYMRVNGAVVGPFLDQAGGDTRYVNVNGDTLTDFLSAHADPTATMHVATKQYVDAKVSGAPGGATLSDTPPAGAVTGQLWVETDSGALFVRWADADSSQWVQLNAFPSLDGYVKKTGDTMSGVLSITNAVAAGSNTLTAVAISGQHAVIGSSATAGVWGSLGYGAYGVYCTGQLFSSAQVTSNAGFFAYRTAAYAGLQCTNASDHTVSYSIGSSGQLLMNSIQGGLDVQISGTNRISLAAAGYLVVQKPSVASYAGAFYGCDLSSSGGLIGWCPYTVYYGIVGYYASSTYYSYYGNSQGVTSGGWVTSDKRLKVENTRRSAVQALPLVMQIPVHSFAWNKATEWGAGVIGGEDSFGWYAQEVEAVIPQAVHDAPIPWHDVKTRAHLAGVPVPEEGTDEYEELKAREDITMKVMNDQFMIATLWQAVQELTAKVEALEAANGV